MRRSITSILIIFSLMLSMTEISNVAVLGYSLMMDAEKAANFCTCLGCSHSSESESEFCTVNMDNKMTHEDDREPVHCDITPTAGGSSVCGCDTSPANQIQVVFNTIDKTALLPALQYSEAELKRPLFKPFDVEKPTHIQRDIFRPPKA